MLLAGDIGVSQARVFFDFLIQVYGIMGDLLVLSN